jgi:hypothetical protein
MNNLSQKKSSSTIIQSGAFVGLRAETSHINTLHADAIYDKNGTDLIDLIRSLSARLDDLATTTARLDTTTSSMTLSSLTDVHVVSCVDGSVLTYDDETKSWVARELD